MNQERYTIQVPLYLLNFQLTTHQGVIEIVH